jgi:hypothetical protein
MCNQNLNQFLYQPSSSYSSSIHKQIIWWHRIGDDFLSVQELWSYLVSRNCGKNTSEKLICRKFCLLLCRLCHIPLNLNSIGI